MKCVVAALAAVLACRSTPAPPASSPASSLPAIDVIAERALHDGGVVGLSIVVMRGDRVVHARGYGVADLAARTPATERSVYILASLSKQFWALAIAQLVEQDRLAVDTSLSDVLPAFPDRRVEVRHLLQQTSGLGDDAAGEDDTGFRDAPKLAFDPGTWWRYSNRGAILAKRVVEQATRGPWDRYLHERIAGPLGLASLATCTMANHVPIYDAHREPWSMPPAELTRIAFVCANALDVARFERSFDTGALVRPATVARMRTPVALAGFTLPYGWLTRIADFDGHPAYGHTGSLPATSIAAFRFPADDLTIVVMMNTAPRPGFRAHELVARIARDQLGLPEPRVAGGTPPAEELDAIVGTYAAGPVRAQIAKRDGGAWLTLTAGDKPVWDGALIWTGGRSFAGGPEGVSGDALATFVPATGPAAGVAVGHRLVLDQLFRREAVTDRSPSSP